MDVPLSPVLLEGIRSRIKQGYQRSPASLPAADARLLLDETDRRGREVDRLTRELRHSEANRVQLQICYDELSKKPAE